MPVIRSGSFVLYGISLAVPSTLTDGALIDPGHAGTYYLTNIGVIPTVLPLDAEWTPPTLLDTTNDGNGWAAGAPPPGFVPNFSVGVNVLMGLFGSGPAGELAPPPIGFNIGNYWSMAGSGHVAFPLTSVLLHAPHVYAELITDFLTLHVQDYHAPAHEIAVWPTTPAASTPTVGPRITGSYDIIAWWWKIPDVSDPCQVRQTSKLTLSEDQPPDDGGTYEKLDPDDSDAAPTPVIDEVTPNHGPIAGGTEITVTGSGFGIDFDLQVDGVSCTDLVYDSQYQVRGKVPAHIAGNADVVLINVDGVSN